MCSAIDIGERPALERLIASDRVTLGLLLPLDNDWARTDNQGATMPDLAQSTRHILLADELGFQAAWLRDVPTFDPLHGDPGQVYDPWTYLGYLAAATRRLTLGTAAVVAPLDHDLHIAKRAASIDRLSNGRFVLGLATGDRPHEYELFNVHYDERAHNFRRSVERLQGLWSSGERYEKTKKCYGATAFELAPKPVQQRLPLTIVGRALQSLEWIASHGDGWFTYADSTERLTALTQEWTAAQERCECSSKPLMLPLRLVLSEDSNAPLMPFPMGVHTGRGELKRYLDTLHQIGVAHVALNLRKSERPVEDVLEEIGRDADLMMH